MVSLPSLPSTSGYQSPHFPALQPGGKEGTCTRCSVSDAEVRAMSHFSTSGSTYTALGPARVIVPRQSDVKSAASRPYRSVRKLSDTPHGLSPDDNQGNPSGLF